MSKTGLPSGRYIEGEECWADLGGYRMRYLHLRAERPTGAPPLLLIHGLLGYSFSWRFNLKAFARDRDVYAIDLLGIGFSDRVPPGKVSFGLRDSAERLFQWADRIGLAKFDVIGSSHGATMAIMMAGLDQETARQRVSRMVLVGPANPYSKLGRKRLWFFSTAAGLLAMRWTGMGRGGVRNYAFRRMYADTRKITRETRDGYFRAMEVPGTADYVFDVVKRWKRDMAEVAGMLQHGIDVPVLFLWGEHDQAVPVQTVRSLQPHFRDSRVVVMKNTGHLPYEEDPETFNREVLAFLAGGAAQERGSEGQQAVNP